MSTTRASVLGTGLMGSAISRYLAGDHADVTVWNRTADKAAALAGTDGLDVARTPDQALQDSDVVFVVLADYSIASQILTDHREHLNGRDVINLMTGSPSEAANFATMIEGCGARYLDGAIEAYPHDIGGSHTLINFAGSRPVWDRHRRLLTSLAGKARYVGTDPGSANVLDAALAGAFYNVSLGAFLEAAAYADTCGVSLDALGESIDYWVDLLRETLHEAVDTIKHGEYGTDQATLSVYLAAVRTWRAVIVESGNRASLMTANMHNLEIAEAAGNGDQAIFTQINTMGTIRPTATTHTSPV